MKKNKRIKIAHTLWLALTVLFLPSCLREMETNMAVWTETAGLMQVDVQAWGGESGDRMETVRFFVFKNPDGVPELELNERFDIPSGGTGEVTRFNITLEVSRKSNGPSNKIVVAVINEPSGMQSVLDGVSNYDQLNRMKLKFADFLNTSHTGLENGENLPMTGVVWTDNVHATPELAASNPVSISVERAVARVDLYIRKESGMTKSLVMDTSAKITLKNTYGEEYFIRNEDCGNSGYTFGLIQTVTSGFFTRTWTPSTTQTIPEYNPQEHGQLLCSFYTPERTCSAADHADKLALDLDIRFTGGEQRTGSITLEKAYNEEEGIEKEIEAILRNNNYRILVTVESHSITTTLRVEILNWTDKEIPNNFN